MKDVIDIIIYFAVVFTSYCIGRCSGLDEKEFKRTNKIGHNPSPPKEFQKPGFPSRSRRPGIETYNSIINIKPPSK